jgi:trehalose 6-phosphate phosphatase
VSYRLPRPSLGETWALFLDFDGTLTEIVASPDRVRVDPALHGTLRELFESLDGALAVISGRPVADVDRYLAPLRLPTAGMHGLEWRGSEGRVLRKRYGRRAPGELRDRLAEIADTDPRLLLEDKDASLALHYRGAPEREAELQTLMTDLVSNLKGYRVLCGKMVLELLPTKSGKGQAIESYMKQNPYRGRRPVFAGDDVTDEDGFAAVARMGGISIKVGDGSSTATYRTPTVSAFISWLQNLPRQLRSAGSADEHRESRR